MDLESVKSCKQCLHWQALGIQFLPSFAKGKQFMHAFEKKNYASGMKIYYVNLDHETIFYTALHIKLKI